MSETTRPFKTIRDDLDTFDNEFDYAQDDALRKWREGRHELVLELEAWYAASMIPE